MTIHSSILAWEIPWTRGAWWAKVHGVTKSLTGQSMHEVLSLMLIAQNPKPLTLLL